MANPAPNKSHRPGEPPPPHFTCLPPVFELFTYRAFGASDLRKATKSWAVEATFAVEETFAGGVAGAVTEDVSGLLPII